MEGYTLDDLEDDRVKHYERQKRKMNRLYHLARDLGFHSSEAVILQGKSEAVIRKLAKERASRKAK